jgi:hypothetical protein
MAVVTADTRDETFTPIARTAVIRNDDGYCCPVEVDTANLDSCGSVHAEGAA